MPVVIATAADIPKLNKLINSAYRGEESKKGWTSEAHLLGGIRTDENTLRELISKPNACILKYAMAQEDPIGCVFLEKKGLSLYLGLLTVSPLEQAKGIGKLLLQESEAYARSHGCPVIEMTVISVRTDLIRWYEHHGYKKTGKTKPFPKDEKFGIPRQALEFVVMQKEI